MTFKQFGGKITKYWLERYVQSSQWAKGTFQNQITTETVLNWRKIPQVFYRQWKGHPDGQPTAPLDILPFNKEAFLAPSDAAKFVWYGHSVLLARMEGQTILIDPMLGDDVTPIAPIKTKRFSEDTLSFIDAFPTIDLIVITHDHYDHLDYESIKRLQSKTKQYFVALGVKRHLVSWGVEEAAIVEFDWWEQQTFEGIQITFTPTRHFSGRGLTSMAKCLWGGWVFKTTTENIWFSGDSGYGAHFQEIGAKLGPFDLAFMECGQYNEDWPDIHLFPAEGVQAALDGQVAIVMPVHWGGFNLSYYHGWKEPVDQFLAAANVKSLKTLTPQLGQIFTKETSSTTWWKK